MNDPYKVLGVSPSASDDEVKAAYRAMARKYHPDNYTDNPLSDLAQEKMQEINEAYDTIMRMRKSGADRSSSAGNAGGYRRSSRFSDIRNLIQMNRIADAEMLLDGVPGGDRDGEWYFLKGSVLYRKGWLEDACSHFQTACNLDPGNMKYRQAYNRIQSQRQTGGYYTGHQAAGGCSNCDICSSLLCADCCCECMGGDLIPCC